MKNILISTTLLLSVATTSVSAFDIRASYKTTELSVVGLAEDEVTLGSFDSYGLGIGSYSTVDEDEKSGFGAGYYTNVYLPTQSEYGQSVDVGFALGYTFLDMLTPKALFGGEAQVLNESILTVAYTFGAAVEVELFEHLIADVTYKYNTFYARLDQSQSGGFEHVYTGSDIIFGLGYRF